MFSSTCYTMRIAENMFGRITMNMFAPIICNVYQTFVVPIAGHIFGKCINLSYAIIWIIWWSNYPFYCLQLQKIAFLQSFVSIDFYWLFCYDFQMSLVCSLSLIFELGKIWCQLNWTLVNNLKTPWISQWMGIFL